MGEVRHYIPSPPLRGAARRGNGRLHPLRRYERRSRRYPYSLYSGARRDFMVHSHGSLSALGRPEGEDLRDPGDESLRGLRRPRRRAPEAALALAYIPPKPPEALTLRVRVRPVGKGKGGVSDLRHTLCIRGYVQSQRMCRVNLGPVVEFSFDSVSSGAEFSEHLGSARSRLFRALQPCSAGKLYERSGSGFRRATLIARLGLKK